MDPQEHQLPETPCHRVGNEVTSQELQGCDCSAAVRQLDSYGLHINNWGEGGMVSPAKYNSRQQIQSGEGWMLSPAVEFNQTLGPLEVNLFASQLTH